MRSLRGARATASLREASLRAESIAEPRLALPAARVSPVVLRLPIVPAVSGRGLVEPAVSGRVLVEPGVSAPVAAGLRVLPGAWALLDPLSVAPCELIEPLGAALRLPIVPVSGRGLVEPGVSGRVLVEPEVSAPVAAGLRVLPGACALLDPLSAAPCELIEPLGLAGCGAVVERAGSDGLGLVVVLWACTKLAVARTATAIAVLVAVFMEWSLLKWLTRGRQPLRRGRPRTQFPSIAGCAR